MFFLYFLRTTAATAVAHLSHRNSVRLSVCLSVHPFVTQVDQFSQKRCKLGSPNLHRRMPGKL